MGNRAKISIQMKLSIIIPVYNEEKTIKEIIDRVKNVDLGNKISKEIIVVNDGSKDQTGEILKRLSLKEELKILTHKKNLGKGAAVRTGIKHCTGEMVIIQDADLEYNPRDYPKLVKPILQGKVKVVYGTRIKLKVTPQFYLSLLGNKLLTWSTNFLYGSSLSDVFVGYKVFRREVLSDLDLKSNGFNIEIELTAKLLKRDVKIDEVPISYQARSWREGKKINFWDGLISLFYVFYYRFFD